MVIFPNCKINLGLRILQKRADGFHDLETVFYPLRICDVLEFLPDQEQQKTFRATGIPISGDPEQNLCIRAWKLLKKDFPELPEINLWLHKVIPSGAGLGGGSADGAFLLKALNEKYRLGLSTQQLIDYALQLGSDCPFFLYNTPCLGSGRGERLEPIAVNLENYYITLIHPGIHISTAWAFGEIRPDDSHRGSLARQIAQGPGHWKGTLINDFETAVFPKYPEIAQIRDRLYDHGALYASMSGSGSSVFGLFREPVHLKKDFPPHYFIRESIPAGFERTGN